MDLMDFILILAGMLLSAAIALHAIRLWNARITQDLVEKRRVSAEMSRKAQIRHENERRRDRDYEPTQEPEVVDVGPWLPDLLRGFGIDPDLIYKEEMPADLKAFMPFIKSYVSAQGGLPGILANLQKSQQQPENTGL
jgi:hypothetical protein